MSDIDRSVWVKDLLPFKNFHFGIAEAFFKKQSWTNRQSDRGYKFFAEGYIHEVFTNSNESTIKAKCYRSQKKNERPHRLHLKFTASIDAMLEAHCTCEAGNSQSCNHLVGLAYFIQHLVLNGFEQVPETASCTSIPMEWNKPRGTKILPQQIPESVFIDPNNTERKKAPVVCQIKRSPIMNNKLEKITLSSVADLKTKLNSINPSIPFASTLCTHNMTAQKSIFLQDGISVPASSLLGHMARAKRNAVSVIRVEDEGEHMEDKELPIALPLDNKDMVDILISVAPVYHASLEPLTMEQAAAVEKNTRQQNQSGLWKDFRKFRFTASKFGYVCKRKLFNSEFVKQFVCPPDVSHIKAVAHGVKNESLAINTFLKQNKKFVYYKCGLVVHPYAIHLGASPDGILYDATSDSFGVLEVKCPCSTKANSLEEYTKLKSFCMNHDQNNTLRLKTSHDYFYQIQGQMLITGLRWAKFVVFIGKTEQIVCDTILFDPIFCQEMYQKLTLRYNEHLKDVVMLNVT